MTYTFRPAIRDNSGEDQADRFLESFQISDGCWEWSKGLFKSGYGRFFLNGKLRRAHRLMWEFMRGEIGDLHVLHRCDNPKCINPDHLFLGTHAENMADMKNKGRHVSNPLKGSMAPGAKLTESKAREIKNDVRPHREIAAEYGVCENLISRIKTGKAWAHV